MRLPILLALGLATLGSLSLPGRAPAEGFPIPPAERAALIDLHNSTNGPGWTDRTGWLGPSGTECDWKGVLCGGPPGFPSVIQLDLAANNLSGTIPAALGNLANLAQLQLSGNQLSGGLPFQLQNLTSLDAGGLDLRFNALFSDDPGLTAFLNARQAGGNWQSSQTVAPLNVVVGDATPSSLRVSWDPIPYTADSGRYQIRFYLGAVAGTTASKTESSFTVTGLAPDATYTFIVETVTDPHPANPNTVTSWASQEVPGTTLPLPPPPPPGFILFPTAGLATGEDGGTARFTVVLDGPPPPATLIGLQLASSDLTEGTVSPNSVMFSASDWDVPKAVTVTGVDDEETDGTVPYLIETVAVAVSISGARGAAPDPPDVSLVNRDDEVDADGDGVVDALDDCPAIADAGQEDLDGDGAGDACDVDDDGDGVADEVERSAPNAGDGNSDGQPDDRQPDVTSLRTTTQMTFMTLAVTGCAGFLDVRATGEAALADPDPAWDFPYGLLHFRLPCAAADVTLRFHDVTPAEALYRQHEAGGWSNLPGAVLLPGPGSLTVTMSLAGSGLIEVLGGPARPPADACGSATLAAPVAAFARPAHRSRLAGQTEIDGPKIVGQHRVTVLAEDADSVTIRYEATFWNEGAAPQFDNPGPELLTFLPPCTQVLEISATSGVLDNLANQVLAWNGVLMPLAQDGGTPVTISATAKAPTSIKNRRIQAGAEEEVLVTWWQTLILSDAHLTGVNDTLGLSDDPSLPGAADPSPVVPQQAAAVDVPTASDLALLALALLLAAAALRGLRRMRSAAVLGLLLALLPVSAFAQKKITCPNGEVRYEVDVKDLALKYEGWSLAGTMGSLNVLGAKLGADQKVLQQAAAATQQWNELLKGLATGWNRCVISKQQYAEGLERIYPRLKEDAADLEKIRQLLAQGQQAEEKRLKTMLDSYFANLRRFAEIGGQDVLLDRIAAIVEREVAEGTERLAEGQDQILRKLADLERRLDEAPLAAPAAAKSEIARKLEEKAQVAEESYQKGYDLMQRFRFREAVPHFEAALAAVKLHEFYAGLGEALLNLSEMDRAESVFREGLALAKEEGSEPHEGEMAYRLGEVLLSKGDLDGALASAQRALEIGEKVGGGRLAEAAGFLSKVLAARGDLDGALDAARRALRTAEAELGPDHPDVAYYANGLGTILYERGDLDGALLAIQRAQRIYEEKLGSEHPYAAEALGNVASILYDQGRYAEALASARRALEIEEKIYGPDHAQVAERVANIAIYLLRLGDLDGALQSARRALQIYERTVGPDHPDVAVAAGTLARTLLEKGDLDAALRFAERALRIEEAAYGPDHPYVALDAGIVAGILHRKGDLDGALAAVQRALRIDEATYGADHYAVAEDNQMLAAILRDRGDLDGALAAGRRALGADELAFGPDHHSVARDSDVLATILLARGDLDAALRFAQRALQIAEKVFGPDHPKTGLYARGVGRVLEKRGDREGARLHLDRALRILSRTYGPDNPTTQRMAEELASLGGQARQAAR